MKRKSQTLSKENVEGHRDPILSDAKVADDVNRNVSENSIDEHERLCSETPLITEVTELCGQQKRCRRLIGETVPSCTELNVICNEREFGTPECIAEDCHIAKNAGGDDVEVRIESAILTLATQRGTQKTFCPSEIPRLVLKISNWRDYMDLTRNIAFKMAASGILDIMQKGIVRSASEYETLRGPMRVRLSP